MNPRGRVRVGVRSTVKRESAEHVAFRIRQALRVPDAARQSGPVRILRPDGTVKATIPFEQFASRPSRLKALARGVYQPVSRA